MRINTFYKKSWQVKWLSKGDTCPKGREHRMPTKKKRKKFALSAAAIEKLEWLVKERQKRSNTKIYPCNTLEELIENDYLIRNRFSK